MAYAGGSAERTAFECLSILHDRGYEQLRLSSGHSPSGMSLRYEIAPAAHFRPDGMRLKSERYGTALMTSSSGKLPPFGWPDAVDFDPQKLADLFLERCPQLAEAGLGHDRAYAAWYREMLAATRPNGLVVFYGEYLDATRDGISVLVLKHKVVVPLPPGPEAATDR